MTPSDLTATVVDMAAPPALDPNESVSSLEESLGRAFARIAPAMELVEGALRDTVQAHAQVIPELGHHILTSGGKRLRPALVLLAAELVGYTGPRRIELAAALELLHTATLVHDDVVDLAEHRRGRPSANAIWGNRRAVLAGDFFYSKASTILIQDGNLEIVESYSRTIGMLAEGELLQLERSFDVDVTESHYYDVIERKSAALLSACAEIGSLLGGVTRTERNRIVEFGRQLGIAFQLKDDCLDYDSELETMGKVRFGDLREGKITLPLILTLKRCRTAEKDHVANVLKSAARLADEHGGAAPVESPELEFGPIAELVTRHRGLEDTQRRAEEHIGKALEAIAPFADGPAKEALIAAARFSVLRDR